MIPRGLIYSELRSQMVQNFPGETKAIFRSKSTLAEWLLGGSLVVTSCNTSQVTFEAPEMEYGSILLTEAENFLNHCFEHLQELGCFCLDSRVRSEAWNAVTTYYLAFFSAATLLRLLGRPVLFVTKNYLSAFATVSGSSGYPRQGTFQLRRMKSISATIAEYRLKSTQKVHEATWIGVLGLLEQLNHTPKFNSDPGSVATLELRRSLAIACAKLDRHRAEQTKNEAME
jgi:hypothetical protein